MGSKDQTCNEYNSAKEDDVFTIAEDDKNQQPLVGGHDKEDKVPPIPDGGWGWVIVLASFLIFIITHGIQHSSDLLHDKILQEFEVEKTSTELLKRLFTVVPLLSGPIMSPLVKRYGCRNMTILGGIVTFLGFVLTSISSTMGMVTVSIGVIAGLGVGLVRMTAIVSIVYWFKKKRNLAVGLSACGIGIGKAAYASLTLCFNIVHGWSGSIFLTAGTILNLCVCGCVMRDPEWRIKEIYKKKNNICEKIKREDDKLMEEDENLVASDRNTIPGKMVNEEIKQRQETIKENKKSLINSLEKKEVKMFNGFKAFSQNWLGNGTSALVS